MGNVAPAPTEGVEDLGKLAIGQKTVKSARPELEDGLVAFLCLEPRLVCIRRDKACARKELKAVLETGGGSCRVAANAARFSARNSKAGLSLVFLGSLEEVRAHLKNLVVCHVQQTETAACDSRIKTKDKVRPGCVHGCSSVSSTMESSIWVDQTLIDAPHARRAEQTASGVTPPPSRADTAVPPRRLGSLSAFLDTLRLCLRVWRETRATGRPARYTDTICVQLAACGRPGR